MEYSFTLLLEIVHCARNLQSSQFDFQNLL